ncbi:MAG: hypothetical protein ACYSVY_11060 [Planctomycetota bacterium]
MARLSASLRSEVLPDDDLAIDALMTAVREHLHDSIERQRITLPAMPAWLADPPEVTKGYVEPHAAASERLVVHEESFAVWNTYWWAGITWLARDVPESGIVILNSKLSRDPVPSWFQGDFAYELLPLLTRIDRRPDDEVQGLWREVARASEVACKCVSLLLAPAEHPSPAQPTPDPVEPTKPVTLTYAAKHWFLVDPRTLKRMIAKKTATAKS